MEPVAIPKTIDDPIHILLWSADEIVPFMVCMLTGMLIDQFIPALVLGVIAVKFYRRFRDNRPDGYTLPCTPSTGWVCCPARRSPSPIPLSGGFTREALEFSAHLGMAWKREPFQPDHYSGLAGGVRDYFVVRMAHTAIKLSDLVKNTWDFYTA